MWMKHLDTGASAFAHQMFPELSVEKFETSAFQDNKLNKS